MIVSCFHLGRVGRLGNQMWQIASTIGIAAQATWRGKQARASFPGWEYAPYFSIPPKLFSSEPGVESYTLCEHMSERFRPYLQDYSLFHGVEGQIRRYFRPSPEALRIMHAPERKWFWDLPRPLTAVHVRRGDNVDPLSNPPGFFPVFSAEYFATAANRFGGSKVVFSDDIPWCREHLTPLIDRIHFYEGITRPKETSTGYGRSPVMDWIDLQLMATCDHHVLSGGSSYSWWGAFLSCDKSPIYPHAWYGDVLASMINWRTMIPDGWIEMRDEKVLNVERKKEACLTS